jgi:hypothetical protein
VVSPSAAAIAVSLANEDAAAVDAAIQSFRRFYATSEVELSGSTIRLTSSEMSSRQLRTAWLSHLLEAKTHEQAQNARRALFEKLFV